MLDLLKDVEFEQLQAENARLREENRAMRAGRARMANPDEEPLWIALSQVRAECLAQAKEYGTVNATILDGTGPNACWTMPIAALSATDVERAFRLDYESRTGRITWADLVREEIAEAFQERDPARLDAELTQAAALIVSWKKVIAERGRVPLTR